MISPCPVCSTTRQRSGFCCDACHALYMAQQRQRWNQPATGMTFQNDLAAFERGPMLGYSLPTTRPARPDPCWATDEQIGSWSRCVRALEECGD